MVFSINYKLGLCVLLSVVLAPSMWPQALQRQAEQLVSSYASRGEFRGSVAIAKDGQVLLQKSYGDAVESWGIANTLDTKFELASLTKQFTGAAILILAQTGKLNLDDAVTKFFPHAPETWRQITIKELVTHTSGLPNNEIQDFNKGILVHFH